LFVNDLCYAFFNLVKIGTSKKLQSFYGGPFIVSKKFSEALFELEPFGTNPIKTNQVVSRDKIRKIDSKVEIMGETIDYNINPVEQIVPSEEITLSIDNTQDIATENDTVFNDFTYLDKEGDDFIEECIDQNVDLNGGEVSEQSLHTNFDNQPSPADIQPQSTTTDLDPETQPEAPPDNLDNSFLKQTLPTEASFFESRPTQSSPEKDKIISVDKDTIVPKYVLNESRKTRSDTRDKIHVQIALQNPLKKRK